MQTMGDIYFDSALGCGKELPVAKKDGQSDASKKLLERIRQEEIALEQNESLLKEIRAELEATIRAVEENQRPNSDRKNAST
jgi:hypothetical protein